MGAIGEEATNGGGRAAVSGDVIAGDERTGTGGGGMAAVEAEALRGTGDPFGRDKPIIRRLTPDGCRPELMGSTEGGTDIGC